MQVAYPQFRIWFSFLCSGWYRSRFSRVVGRVSFVFHYWWVERSYLRLRGVLLWSFVGLPLTAKWYQFRWVQAPFTKYAGCKNLAKTAFVRLKLQENGYPIQYKPITIQLIPYRYQTKQSTQSRSAQILRKKSKTPRSRRNEQSIPPIMKNERYSPNNPTDYIAFHSG